MLPWHKDNNDTVFGSISSCPFDPGCHRHTSLDNMREEGCCFPVLVLPDAPV